MFYEVYGGKCCQMSLAALVSLIQSVLQSFSPAWDMLFFDDGFQILFSVLQGR